MCIENLYKFDIHNNMFMCACVRACVCVCVRVFIFYTT